MNAASGRPQRLRIAVVGAGSIGSTFAFQLARAGHEVTAIARPGSKRASQLQRDQAIVQANGERVAVLVADALDEAIPFDLIVVTVLAHQVDAVLPAFQRSNAHQILFLFNNYQPELLQQAMGAERCAFGMPFVQASLDEEGHLQASIGAGGQKTKVGDRGIVETFNAAGLPSVFEANMLLWLRCHAPLCVAFESVSVAGVSRNGGATWARAMTIARGMQESFTLIARLGHELYPSGKRLLHRGPAWVAGAMLWSMSRIPSFRNLLATGADEARSLVAALIASAARAQPPVSVAKIESMRP